MGAPLRSVSSLTKWGPLWSVSSLAIWGPLNFFLKFYALNYSWGALIFLNFQGGGGQVPPLVPPPAGAHESKIHVCFYLSLPNNMANRTIAHEDVVAFDYATKRRRILQLSEHKLKTRSRDIATSYWKYMMIEKIKEYIEEEMSREESDECSSLGSLSDYSFSDSDDEDVTETDNHQDATENSEDTTAANMLEQYLRQEANTVNPPLEPSATDICADVDEKSNAEPNLDVQNEVDAATSFLDDYLHSDEQPADSYTDPQWLNIPTEPTSTNITIEPYSTNILDEAIESIGDFYVFSFFCDNDNEYDLLNINFIQLVNYF